MLSPDRMQHPMPLATAAADYDVVRRAIGHIRGHWREQPEIESIAEAAGVAPTELHRLFRRWAGLSPKAFVQALTLDGARRLLRDSASVLDATYEVGLSGPGRLHDLFVTHEAMSPGEWKSGGEGLTIHFGFHPSPFGSALVMATERGLAGGGNRHAYLRSLAMAGGTAAARRADRHRFRGAGLGGAVADSDGQARDLFGHRHQACQSHRFARGRRRSRQEPGVLRGAVPPRRRQRWRSDRLPLGHHAQAGDAGLGSRTSRRRALSHVHCRIETRACILSAPSKMVQQADIRKRCTKTRMVNGWHDPCTRI